MRMYDESAKPTNNEPSFPHVNDCREYSARAKTADSIKINWRKLFYFLNCSIALSTSCKPSFVSSSVVGIPCSSQLMFA